MEKESDARIIPDLSRLAHDRSVAIHFNFGTAMHLPNKVRHRLIWRYFVNDDDVTPVDERDTSQAG